MGKTNSKNSSIEAKKAQNDPPPEKQKNLKVRKGEVFLKWKLAVFIIKPHNASRGSPPPQKLLDRAQKKSKSQKTKKSYNMKGISLYE